MCGMLEKLRGDGKFFSIIGILSATEKKKSCHLNQHRPL